MSSRNLANSETGEELGVIRRLADLEPNSRELLEDELYQRYETIVIERVLSVKRDPISGLIRWAVEVERDETDELQLAAGLKPTFGRAPVETRARQSRRNVSRNQRRRRG